MKQGIRTQFFQQSLKYFQLAIVTLLFFVMSTPAYAESTISLVPSRVVTVQLPDTQQDYQFTYRRSEVDTTQKFRIVVPEDAGYISLLSDSIVSLDINEDSFSVPFTIDTAELPVGDYETALIITPVNEGEQKEALVFNFEFSAEIRLSVIEELPEEYAAVDYESAIFGEGAFTLSNLQLDSNRYKEHDTIIASWKIGNTTDTPARNIPYTITVFQNDAQIFSSSSTVNNIVSANSTEEFEWEYTASTFGNYTIVLEALGQSSSVSLRVAADSWVVEYKSYIVTTGVGLLLIAIIILAKAVITSRHSGFEFHVTYVQFGIVLAIGIGAIIGLILVWYSAQPRARLVDSLNKQIEGVIAVTDTIAGEPHIGIYPLNGSSGYSLAGDWVVHALTLNRYVAVPGATNEKAIVHMFTDMEQYSYDVSGLPGAVERVHENFNYEYIIFEGVYESSTAEEKRFYCMSLERIAITPDCTYVSSILPHNAAISAVQWSTNLERYLYVQTDDIIYRIDPVDSSVEETDLTDITVISEPAAFLGTAPATDVTVYGDITEFEQFDKRYTIPQATYYSLFEEMYIMRSSNNYLFVFDALTGEHRSIRSITDEAELYLIEPGQYIYSYL